MNSKFLQSQGFKQVRDKWGRTVDNGVSVVVDTEGNVAMEYGPNIDDPKESMDCGNYTEREFVELVEIIF